MTEPSDRNDKFGASEGFVWGRAPKRQLHKRVPAPSTAKSDKPPHV